MDQWELLSYTDSCEVKLELEVNMHVINQSDLWNKIMRSTANKKRNAINMVFSFMTNIQRSQPIDTIADEHKIAPKKIEQNWVYIAVWMMISIHKYRSTCHLTPRDALFEFILHHSVTDTSKQNWIRSDRMTDFQQRESTVSRFENACSIFFTEWMNNNIKHIEWNFQFFHW